jgi:hypothetical protein
MRSWIDVVTFITKVYQDVDLHLLILYTIKYQHSVTTLLCYATGTCVTERKAKVTSQPAAVRVADAAGKWQAIPPQWIGNYLHNYLLTYLSTNNSDYALWVHELSFRAGSLVRV